MASEHWQEAAYAELFADAMAAIEAGSPCKPAAEVGRGSEDGIYLVFTDNGSRYLFSIYGEAHTWMLRRPATHPEAELIETGFVASQLYGDERPLPCVIIRLRVGEPGLIRYLKMDRLDDPGYGGTTRTTGRVSEALRIGSSQ